MPNRERCPWCHTELAASTPPETPHAKLVVHPRRSMWDRLSGAPGREREGRGFAAMGALLLLATGALNWRDVHGVLVLTLAWLAFAAVLWVRRRT
jgi:hypothetical protein